MTRRRLALIVVLIVSATGAFALGTTLRMPDFAVYHTGAARAASGESLYRSSDLHYQYKYLPAFAVLTLPLGYLPLDIAKGIWFALTVASIVTLIALSIRVLPEKRKPQAFLWVSAIVVMGKFYVRELQLGQANALFAAIALVGLLSLKNRHEKAGGIAAAASVAVKPYGIVLLPWLLTRRKIASILAMCAGLLAVAALPVPLYGVTGTIHLHRAWWDTVTSTTAPNLLNPDNVSIASMYARWFGPGGTSTSLALVTIAALLVYVVWVLLRRRGVEFPEGLEGTMMLMLVPLLSPQGWDYVLLIATPAVIYMVNYLDRLPRVLRIISVLAALTIGLILFDFIGRVAYAAFMNVGSITICWIALVVVLGNLRARQLA